MRFKYFVHNDAAINIVVEMWTALPSQWMCLKSELGLVTHYIKSLLHSTRSPSKLSEIPCPSWFSLLLRILQHAYVLSLFLFRYTSHSMPFLVSMDD